MVSCNSLRCRIFEFLDTPAELVMRLAGLWSKAMAWVCGVEIVVGDGGDDE